MSLTLLGCGRGGGGGGGGGPTDPNFSSVKLLMGFEDSNGSTGAPGMTDESPAAHGNAATSGTASISTAQFKFGSSSLLLNGSSAISFADSSDWDLGAGLFTVETFFRPDSLGASNQFLVGQWDSSSGQQAWLLYTVGTSNNIAWLMSANGSATAANIVSSSTISVSTWYHACVDYDGAKYRLYQDGVMVGSFGTPTTIFNSNLNLTFGMAAAHFVRLYWTIR
jgi:Concanavalin A-like lectin/glucanases superfamily